MRSQGQLIRTILESSSKRRLVCWKQECERTWPVWLEHYIFLSTLPPPTLPIEGLTRVYSFCRRVQNVFSPFQAFRSWGTRRSPTPGPLRCCQRLTKKEANFIFSSPPPPLFNSLRRRWNLNHTDILFWSSYREGNRSKNVKNGENANESRISTVDYFSVNQLRWKPVQWQLVIASVKNPVFKVSCGW